MNHETIFTTHKKKRKRKWKHCLMKLFLHRLFRKLLKLLSLFTALKTFKNVFLILAASIGCKLMYVQSLTLRGCFHNHLLKVESFSALRENLILCLLGIWAWYVTSRLAWKPNGPVCSLHKCDVETRNLQCTNTENELYSEVSTTRQFKVLYREHKRHRDRI